MTLFFEAAFRAGNGTARKNRFLSGVQSASIGSTKRYEPYFAPSSFDHHLRLVDSGLDPFIGEDWWMEMFHLWDESIARSVALSFLRLERIPRQ
jgi:hypothetical protein